MWLRAEDSIWDLHQPSSGQNLCWDRWPWEDRGQRDGGPHHGRRAGRPRVPPPEDAVVPVHQSGPQWAEWEGCWKHCPGIQVLKGGSRKILSVVTVTFWTHLPPPTVTITVIHWKSSVSLPGVSLDCGDVSKQTWAEPQPSSFTAP